MFIEIVSFPITVMYHSYVKLPEGNDDDDIDMTYRYDLDMT